MYIPAIYVDDDVARRCGRILLASNKFDSSDQNDEEILMSYVRGTVIPSMIVSIIEQDPSKKMKEKLARDNNRKNLLAMVGPDADPNPPGVPDVPGTPDGTPGNPSGS